MVIRLLNDRTYLRSLTWAFGESCMIVHGITSQTNNVQCALKCTVWSFSSISKAAISNGDFSTPWFEGLWWTWGFGNSPIWNPANWAPHRHMWCISYHFLSYLAGYLQKRFRTPVQPEYDDNYRSRSNCLIEPQKNVYKFNDWGWRLNFLNNDHPNTKWDYSLICSKEFPGQKWLCKYCQSKAFSRLTKLPQYYISTILLWHRRVTWQMNIVVTMSIVYAWSQSPAAYAASYITAVAQQRLKTEWLMRER